MNQKIKVILKSVFVLVLFTLSFSVFAVWQAPTTTPTGNNTQPPINVGGILQYKPGNLVVDGFKSLFIAIFDGNVGIGTSTLPAYKLDVVGDVNFTGTLRQNGVAFSSTDSTKVLKAGDTMTGALSITASQGNANALTIVNSGITSGEETSSGLTVS